MLTHLFKHFMLAGILFDDILDVEIEKFGLLDNVVVALAGYFSDLANLVSRVSRHYEKH